MYGDPCKTARLVPGTASVRSLKNTTRVLLGVGVNGTGQGDAGTERGDDEIAKSGVDYQRLASCECPNCIRGYAMPSRQRLRGQGLQLLCLVFLTAAGVTCRDAEENEKNRRASEGGGSREQVASARPASRADVEGSSTPIAHGKPRSNVHDVSAHWNAYHEFRAMRQKDVAREQWSPMLNEQGREILRLIEQDAHAWDPEIPEDVSCIYPPAFAYHLEYQDATGQSCLLSFCSSPLFYSDRYYQYSDSAADRVNVILEKSTSISR